MDMPTMETKREFERTISELKSKYNVLYSEKESLANKRSEVGSNIRTVIKQVQSVKKERNALNDQIKEIKVQRDSKNNSIRELIEKAKAVNINKTPGAKNPSQLKRELDALNMKYQTEALSFDKEKKLMKIIKDVKKEYNKAVE